MGDRRRSVAEWTSLGISLTILLVLAGLVGYEAIVAGGRPPVIEVTPRLEAVRRVGDAYYLPIEIANSGEETAEDVRVRLSLASAGGEREATELLVPFLAGGATANATAAFRADPAAGGLTVDGVSFLEP
jgi:uncharacterized protein (TIGR02588 family)